VIIDWKLRRIGDQANLLKYSTILTFIRAVPSSKLGGIPIIMVEAFMLPCKFLQQIRRSCHELGHDHFLLRATEGLFKNVVKLGPGNKEQI
jgi:hypothetical protein